MKQHKVHLNKEIGEVFCDKCNGRGTYPRGMYQLRCPKCKGKKTLDWCEQILGVSPEEPDAQYLSFQTYVEQLHNDSVNMFPYQEKIVEEMANEMAKKIDKEILDTLMNDSEHNINDKKGK